MIAEGLDVANITGLSIGGMLMALVFRTLWKQEGGWRAVLESSREDAKVARQDAATARTDAAAARTDAAAARTDTREARADERECQRRLTHLENVVSEIRRTGASNTKRLDVIDATPPVEGPGS